VAQTMALISAAAVTRRLLRLAYYLDALEDDLTLEKPAEAVNLFREPR